MAIVTKIYVDVKTLGTADVSQVMGICKKWNVCDY
jgi:hypothetical protein